MPSDPQRAVQAFSRANALWAGACHQRKEHETSKKACEHLERLLEEGSVVPAVVNKGGR